MDPVQTFLQASAHLEAQIGYQFKDNRLLLLAFTHRSFINEYREPGAEHNERLEFLGDSVLGLLIAEHLYRNKPDTPEGALSHIRSRLVQAETCAAWLSKLHVAHALLLGKGERMGDHRGRESIHADLFEAIIGAIFLDGGFEAAKDFLFNHFTQEIQELISHPGRNFKAELQDYAQRQFQQTPVYTVEFETGPDHNKSFIIEVSIAGLPVGKGQGNSKKEAQQAAAQDALSRIPPPHESTP